MQPNVVPQKAGGADLKLTAPHFRSTLNATWYSHCLPKWHSGKESACQCKRHKWWGFNPWAGKTSWSRKRQPTPTFLSGKFHGQRSLVGYSPGCLEESDTTEQLNTAQLIPTLFLYSTHFPTLPFKYFTSPLFRSLISSPPYWFSAVGLNSYSTKKTERIRKELPELPEKNCHWVYPN